ncbi:S8 family peptidase [Priestia endophytica]|uniref:S8 family peptidase n=1 Tax=Priestia endophytica TaxID=135735 RepID=UPI00124E8DA2|nr:S8 family serine peptidase [Priestia endophytica]KAB2496355.1 S8 family serine peptidase [Priestia endophytica]
MRKKDLISLLFCSILFLCMNAKVQADGTSYYSVLLSNPEYTEDFLREVQQHNMKITYVVREIGLIQIKASEAEVQRLNGNKMVRTYNYSLKASTSAFSAKQSDVVGAPSSLWDRQWDMKEITNNGKSYTISEGSKEVVVGIIDSGIDEDHPALQNNIIKGSENLVPQGGFRETEQSEKGIINNIEDLTGHGTHVAGQVAANGVVRGVAPQTSLKSYRVFGTSSAESIWIIKGIIEAAKDDVDVINLSLGEYLTSEHMNEEGGSSKSQLAEILAYEKAVMFAEGKGSIVVASVGNDSVNFNNKNEVSSFMKSHFQLNDVKVKGHLLDVPAHISGVVAVTSTGPAKELSVFSNKGRYVDLSAPGGDIKLLQAYGVEQWRKMELFTKEQVLSTSPKGGYIYMAGTSSAAPKVSGTLALIIDQYHLKDNPKKAKQKLLQKSKRSAETNIKALNTYKAIK